MAETGTGTGMASGAGAVAVTALGAGGAALGDAASAAGHAASADWRRRAGLAGAALGVVAAGAAAGVALERLTVGRGMRRKARLALDAAAPYGALRGAPGTATADDGTPLHYETEEPDTTDGDGAAVPTVVFSHGYCLNQDSWHFQRAALRGRVRAVYWDQRGHGRSGRGAGPVSIDRLGRDLRAVVDAAAPEGPLVLVGHSMGGMTVMAFADQYPELVRDRVAAFAFLGTSSGRLAELTYGLPALPAHAVQRALPGVLRALGGRAELVERGRRATADLFAGLIKRYGFGSRDVDPVVARFAERMIEATPIDVVADFYPAFAEHDKADALAALAETGVPVLALAGARDLVTPPSHTEAVAALLPGAELVVVPGGGHLVMLEHPDTVTARLVELLARAGVPAPDDTGAAGGSG
ncbi:alpha/beta hydrolase [Streptomyces fradiae]|nr:alpha/beta hydrolase [Streptomyces fradiae]WOI62891.1 alpha/beta hydrolase [Streptomyces fradiae]